MFIETVISDLGVKPGEFARRLDVSDGHIYDIISGRRKLSLKLAIKIEEVTGRKDVVAEVVRQRSAA